MRISGHETTFKFQLDHVPAFFPNPADADADADYHADAHLHYPQVDQEPVFLPHPCTFFCWTAAAAVSKGGLKT